MTGIPIVTPLVQLWKGVKQNSPLPPQRDLHTLWDERAQLRRRFQTVPTAFRLLELLGPLHWAEFPERDLMRDWGQPTIPYAALAATALVQLNESLVSMRQVRTFLVEHPVFGMALGLPAGRRADAALED